MCCFVNRSWWRPLFSKHMCSLVPWLPVRPTPAHTHRARPAVNPTSSSFSLTSSGARSLARSGLVHVLCAMYLCPLARIDYFAGGDICCFCIFRSRNTEQKQWDETLVLSLNGMGRLLRTYLAVLTTLEGFDVRWDAFLAFFEKSVIEGNREVAVAAIGSLTAILQVRALPLPPPPPPLLQPSFPPLPPCPAPFRAVLPLPEISCGASCVISQPIKISASRRPSSDASLCIPRCVF